MKIAFYSKGIDREERQGVLVALSTVLGKVSQKSILIIEDTDISEKSRKVQEVFFKVGQEKAGKWNHYVKETSCYNYKGSALYSCQVPECSSLDSASKQLLGVSEISEIVIYNIHNENTRFAEHFLKKADIVIVYFNDFSRKADLVPVGAFLKGETFFLGQIYEEIIEQDVYTLEKKYRIDGKKLIVFPRIVTFQNAMQRNEVIPYVKKIMKCRKQSQEKKLLKALEKVSDSILECLENREEKDCLLK